MKLLHTSDWHLGHMLHSVPRLYEHQRFLDWLVEVLRLERVDALIIAGDVFDSANPPASAMELWFSFLARAARAVTHLQVVVIGGNHDSAARLNAPTALLEVIRVQVVGGIPRTSEDVVDWDRLSVPLRNAQGRIEAWCAAMPYIRVADLPPNTEEEGRDNLVEGVRRLYGELLQRVRAKCTPGKALIATGHCYMTGSSLSELSERKILGGNQHALPLSIFPDFVDYVALGHLHCPQIVGGRESVRYSGSPLPLSLSEADYDHRVVLVDIEAGGLKSARDLTVPRAVRMIRLPAAEPRAVLQSLAELEPLPAHMSREQRPFLEVRVLLRKPAPGLRREIEEAMSGKAPRLLKLTAEYKGDGRVLAERARVPNLADLRTEEVFANCYRRRFEGDPPSRLMELFHELVETVGREAS